MNESTNITTMDPVVIQMKLKELELMKAKAAEKADKQKLYNERRRIWMQLMIAKAEKQGVTVTPAEVDAELKKIKKA